MQPQDGNERMTMKTVRRWCDEGRKLAMLTCYDATTAKWLSRAGVRAMLVGDSAAQVILGYENSMYAPLDVMIALTAAVRRGAPDCLLMGDMPFMSYQADDSEAVRNAGRFMTEGNADLVKLEVDGRYMGLMEKLARAGIPSVAHIGWRPQLVRYEGIKTARVAGRTQKEIDTIVALAQQMEQAGAVMLLLEQCTAQTAEQVVAKVNVPVIGCGAGPACHGHVVVLQDVVGMTEKYPSFIKPTGSIGPQLQEAASAWVKHVESGDYLKTDHPYGML